MKLQWVANLIAWAYRTFLKGRTVKIGGQDVVLPSQGPGLPGQASLDSTPHAPGPVEGVVPRR